MNFRRKAKLKGRGIAKSLLGLSKRERLIISVIALSIGLFTIEHFLGISGIFFILSLAIMTNVLLFFSLYNDMQENFSWQIFILPFFFSLAFGLFFFLVPVRYLTRIFTTSLYGIGLYSLFLSQNIFTVSSIRTIALLSSARTVSFIMTLITYFFLSNVLFSLHLNYFFYVGLLTFYTVPLVTHSIWSHTFEKKLSANIQWTFILSLILIEIGSFLWFWPSTPTVLAIFLTGVFYTTIGLSQVWFDKRLFKSVLWEYIWVSAVTFVSLIVFSSWMG